MNSTSHGQRRTKGIFDSVHHAITASMRNPIIWIGLSIAGILWALLSLSLPNTYLGAPAKLTNTTLYSTHPKVVYAPESCCVYGPFGWCMNRYDPFKMSTYVDPNSIKRTFFQTSSWGHDEPDSPSMNRRVQITFLGRAVYVYGPPRTQLENLPGNIKVSLNGRAMATIDLETTYREANDDSPWNPQLMYKWESGAGDATHTLEISLLDSSSSNPIRGFGFDSVVVTSLEPWSRSKYEPRESERLEKVVIQDTNFVTSFAPSYAWQKSLSRVATSEVTQTFQYTSNRLAYESHNDGEIPVTKFTAQCAALEVYGASPAQLEATLERGFIHGHLQICLKNYCEYVDAHQAYLHVPERLRNEPVLLYATDRMSPSAPETVTMKFLDSLSPVGHLWAVSFSHAVCSQVVPRWPWTHPIPNGHYSTRVIGFDRLSYAPSFLFGRYSPWTQAELYSSAPAELYWHSGMYRGMPSWSTEVRGHDIKIYVPSPAVFPELRYANMRCCVDGRCHHPDIEQWLLKGNDSDPDVLLVHYQDLSPFQDHQISMIAVHRDDEVGEKVIAVSRVVYERVVVVPGRSPTHSMPSTPTEDPNMPAPDEPVQYPDDGIGAPIVAGLALSAMGCVALFLIMNARRHPPAQGTSTQQPLTQSLLPTAAPARSRPIDTSRADSGRIAPPPYDACMTADHEINPPPQPHPPITRPAAPPFH